MSLNTPGDVIDDSESTSPFSPHQLLGLHPSDDKIIQYVASISLIGHTPDAADPVIAAYPDAVYFNYHALGLSLLFVPQSGYKPSKNSSRSQLVDENLVLDGIDIYNVPKPKQQPSLPSQLKPSTRTAELKFSTHPMSPLVLQLPSEEADILRVVPDSTGKDFVEHLREPDRKGGGAGPSSGSINIWCEWSKKGIMVEFGGDEAKGPQAWERGKDAVWKVISVFAPKL